MIFYIKGARKASLLVKITLLLSKFMPILATAILAFIIFIFLFGHL